MTNDCMMWKNTKILIEVHILFNSNMYGNISKKVRKKCMKISKGESEILMWRRTDKKNDKKTQ
jgi:hypothetical protein